MSWRNTLIYADLCFAEKRRLLIDWLRKRIPESAFQKAHSRKRIPESANWKEQITGRHYFWRAPLFLKGATTLNNSHYLRRVPLFDSCMSFLQGATNLLCLSHVFPLGATASAKAEKSVKFLSLLMLINRNVLVGTMYCNEKGLKFMADYCVKLIILLWFNSCLKPMQVFDRWYHWCTRPAQ